MEKCENEVDECPDVKMNPNFGSNNEKEVDNTMFDSEKNESKPSIVIKTRKSIAERRADKCGFNASKISSQLPSPSNQSPYLTIPAGISPTELLDSPILLPNSQSSPTTGSFASPPLAGGISQALADLDKGNDGSSSSMLKPKTAVENQSLGNPVYCHSLASIHAPVEFELPVQFSREVTMNDHDANMPLDRKNTDDPSIKANYTNLQPCNTNILDGVQIQGKNEHSQGQDSQKETYPPTGTVRTAEDGYNWRKYGQKQVKGSEYPRSYYKCTHPSCQVKKKVERSHDGHITEIIYKGAHDHPKPQPCRKSGFGLSLSNNKTSDIGDGNVSCVKSEVGSVWRNIQPGLKADGMRGIFSTSFVTASEDPMSTTEAKPLGVLESAGSPEFPSTLGSHDDDGEDDGTQGRFSLGDEEDYETDSKRRKIETTSGSRAVREPRVVVQLESEVDILDDGYRWRKYGQKVVKGNPNPRSYYKCTSAGCTVRKHVERASGNLKSVLTTYEGKHNHEVPAAKNSSHVNPGGENLPPPATNTQSALMLPGNPHFPKPEPHVQDFPPHFDRRLEYNSDFLRRNFLGSLGGGNSPFCQMNFPNLPTNPTSYGPFGLSNCYPAPYPNGILPSIPDLSIPLPLGFPCSSNLGIANYCNSERPLSSVEPLFAGHQLQESDVKLLRPKQELKDDSFDDTEMRDIDHINSSSSSLNNHIVENFPS